MKNDDQKMPESPLDLLEIIHRINSESAALVAYAGPRSKVTEDARRVELTSKSIYDLVSKRQDQIGRRGRIQSCRNFFSVSSVGWCALERIARSLPEDPYYEIYFKLEKIRDYIYRIQESRSRSIALYGHTLMNLITQGKDCLEDLRSDPTILVDVATLCRDAFDRGTPEWTTMNELLESISSRKDVMSSSPSSCESISAISEEPFLSNRENQRA